MWSEIKYSKDSERNMFPWKCLRAAHTTNVLCLVSGVITNLMHPAFTFVALYPFTCVLVFTRRVLLQTKCTHLDFRVIQFLCCSIWQISPFTMNCPFFLCREEEFLFFIQFIRWNIFWFQVFMVRSNNRQSLSHWYWTSNVPQCCIYGVVCCSTLNQISQFSNLIYGICFEVS